MQDKHSKPTGQATAPPNASVSQRGEGAWILQPGASGKGFIHNGKIAIASNLGSTTMGSRWARRALNPCDETHGGAEKIPDANMNPTVCVETRLTKLVEWPTDVEKPTGNLSYHFKALAIPECPLIGRYKKPDGKWSYWTPVLMKTGDLAPGWMTVGHENTAAAFLTQSGLTKGAQKFRTAFHGLTFVLNCNSLSNQGLVTAAQSGEAPESAAVNPFISGTAIELHTAKVSSLIWKGGAETSTELVNAKMAPAVWEARKGAYIVTRFNNATHLFTDVGGDAVGITGGDTDVVYGKPVLVSTSIDGDSINDRSDRVWRSEHSWDTMLTAGEMNQNSVDIFFEGISPDASILVKSISCTEFIPDASSAALNALQTESPELDDQAIKAVDIAQHEMQPIYEHKYNSLGLLSTVIQKLAPWVVGKAAPWIADRLGYVQKPARYME
jgi:hypothetical protein